MKISDVVACATNTFSLPQVCTQLRTTLDDPKSDTGDIAKVISADPLLTVKLLRLANSAFFRFSQQVESVEKSVAILGGEAIYNLAIAEAMSCAKLQFNSSLLDTEQLWLDCLFCATVAKELARSNRVRGVERFFVLGLMSRLSEMVIATHFEKEYEHYLEQKLLSLPWHAQKAEFGFSFAKANGAICEVWGLPPTLYEPLSKVFSLTEKNTDKDTKTLQLAIKLCLYFYKNDNFIDLSSIQSDLSVWRHDEDTLNEMLKNCYAEAKRLQNFL